jgi:hypothetical protein
MFEEPKRSDLDFNAVVSKAQQQLVVAIRIHPHQSRVDDEVAMTHQPA